MSLGRNSIQAAAALHCPRSKLTVTKERGRYNVLSSLYRQFDDDQIKKGSKQSDWELDFVSSIIKSVKHAKAIPINIYAIICSIVSFL